MNKLALQQELFKTRGEMLQTFNKLGLLDEIIRLTPPRYDPPCTAPYTHLLDIDEACQILRRRLNTDPKLAAIAFMEPGVVN